MSKRDFDQAFGTTRSQIEQEQSHVRRVILAGWVIGGSFVVCALASLGYGIMRVLTNAGLW